jgi:hypothetical protein
MPEGDREYGLVMPFLPVASRGGPYDDGAYCAGYEMGRLDEALKGALGVRRVEATIRMANVQQADLIAMQHGYHCTADASDDHPDWTHAIFEPSRGESDAQRSFRHGPT